MKKIMLPPKIHLTGERLENLNNIKEEKVPATIDNTDLNVLNNLFKDPVPKKKRKAQKRSDKRRVDKRLKVWLHPKAHSKQCGLNTKRAKKRRANDRRRMGVLVMNQLLYRL